MRFVSADSSSDLSLPASVVKKRLVVSARCPITSNDAGKTSWSHFPAPDNNPNSTSNRAVNSNSVMAAALPADKRGSPAIKYNATTETAARVVQTPHAGCTIKCSLSMLEVMCAMASAAGNTGPAGVLKNVPTPTAVPPIITILSVYLDAGIFPETTS